MTHLLIVLAATCGAGVDILAESQPDGLRVKRGCCQENSDATVRAVPTSDLGAAVKPCCAKRTDWQNALANHKAPGAAKTKPCCGFKKESPGKAATGSRKKPGPSCAKQAARGKIVATPTAGLPHATVNRPAKTAQERVNTFCPVCDRRIADDSEIVSYNGFQLGVCPGLCHTTFRDTSAMEKDTFIARLAKPISSRCAITGCQCPRGSHFATFNGSVVSLCCDTCRNYWYDSDDAARAGWVRKNVYGIASAEGDGHPLRRPQSGATAAQAARSTIAAKTTPNTTVMEVNGMTCQACVDKVAAALQSVSGVKTVQIDLDEKLVRVETESANAIPNGRLVKVVEAAGFHAKILARTATRSKENSADTGVSAQSIPSSEEKPACSRQVQARMVLLEVAGMASEADARAVEDALGAMKGVFRTTVDRKTKLVDMLVDLTGPVDAERAVSFLSLAGYEVKEASQEQYDAETERLRNGGAIVQYADSDEVEKR